MHYRAAAADVNDAAGTDQLLIAAPAAGVLRIDECYVIWTEAVGTMTSTAGTLDLKVGGTTVATLTSVAGTAVGGTTFFTAASDKYIEFSAADAILVEIGTQATGGTVTYRS